MSNGQALTESFSVNEQLANVRLFVQMKQNMNASTFTFMTSFPRKVFTEEDMEKPLKELGEFRQVPLYGMVTSDGNR